MENKTNSCLIVSVSQMAVRVCLPDLSPDVQIFLISISLFVSALKLNLLLSMLHLTTPLSSLPALFLKINLMLLKYDPR